MKKSILFLLIILGINTLFAQEQTDEKFVPSGKFSGVVFGDYYYKLNGDTMLSGDGQYQKTEKNMNGFSLRRLYLGYEYKFTKNISGRLLLEGNDGVLVKDKRGTVIKYAYVKWKNIFPGSALIIGAQSTPIWSPFTEKIWLYRNVEKTIMDFRKNGSSSDVGISLSGRIDKEGIFNYYVMIANGEGQKVEDDKYKKIYGSVNAKLFDKKLLVEVYSDYEPDDNEKSRTSFKGFIGVDLDFLIAGVEHFYQWQTKYGENDADILVGGTTVFARGPIIKDKVNAFGRIDFFDEDMNITDDGYKEIFTVLGLEYTPVKKVGITPNFWINSYSPKNSGTPDRVTDVVARLTFSYKF